MSHDGRLGRVFFTSIPKCGKNILYSFLSHLSLFRLPELEVDRDLAVQFTYLRYFPDLQVRSTFAYPPLASEGVDQLALGAGRFLVGLQSMPEGVMLNHHFAFVPELYDSLQSAGIPVVFLYRDPRGCLLSMANYVLHKAKPSHLVLRIGDTLEEALSVLLAGDQALVPFASYFDSFRGWLEARHVLTLRFEDIVGPRGGGTESQQLASLTALAQHIGWSGSPHQLETAIESSFNTRSSTFHRGHIDAWREVFSAKILQTFAEKAGWLPHQWGYND